MAIMELFSTSNLFSIAIIVLVGCVFAYFNYKLAEQNHKLNSMLGLISTVAEETQFCRSKLNVLHTGPLNDELVKNIDLSGGNTISLIDVSDDEGEYEEDEDESEDDEDDDEDESESEGDDVDDDDDESDLEVQEANENNNINIDLMEHELKLEELQESVKMIHLEEPIDIPGSNGAEEEINLGEINESEFLKNVIINEAGDNDDASHKTDYRRMSLTKLRDIVISKGLVSDASKLKKQDIIKMIENIEVPNSHV